MLLFDHGVSDVNTGFPLLFVVLSMRYDAKHFTLDFLQSNTIHFVFNKVTFLDGRHRQLLFALQT